MAEGREPSGGGGPGSALRPAMPPGVWLPQDGLWGPGAGRAAGADTRAAQGDGPSWDSCHRPAPSKSRAGAADLRGALRDTGGRCQGAAENFATTLT